MQLCEYVSPVKHGIRFGLSISLGAVAPRIEELFVDERVVFLVSLFAALSLSAFAFSNHFGVFLFLLFTHIPVVGYALLLRDIFVVFLSARNIRKRFVC
jgi:hypothetical protein